MSEEQKKPVAVPNTKENNGGKSENFSIGDKIANREGSRRFENVDPLPPPPPPKEKKN